MNPYLAGAIVAVIAILLWHRWARPGVRPQEPEFILSIGLIALILLLPVLVAMVSG